MNNLFTLPEKEIIQYIKNTNDIVGLAKSSFEHILSGKVQSVMFEALTDNQINNPDIPHTINIYSTKIGLRDTEHDISKFFRHFSEDYPLLLKEKSPELFHKIINTPISEHVVYRLKSEKEISRIDRKEISFMQLIYLDKSMTDKNKALDFYNAFEEEINQPITQKFVGVNFETNVFEYMTKRALSEEDGRIRSWDFFVPLTNMMERLSEKQQEMFTAIAMSQLFENKYGDASNVLAYKSKTYGVNSVFESLSAIPYPILEKFAHHGDIEDIHKDKLHHILLAAKLKQDLNDKNHNKRVKI